MQPGYIKVTKTARYFLSAPLEKEYKSLCFVLHGYGQLAPYFIRKFRSEALSDILFVAPEGLHRFYLEGSGGRIGASWMTKEDRLTDIEDYCAYLDQLYDHFQAKIKDTGSVGVLGFSQGVATACRWLARSRHPFHYLVNWAGAFPPDLDFEAALEKTRNIPLWMVAGTQDEYISGDDFRAHTETVKRKGFDPETLLFEGGHSIETEPLVRVFRNIIA